MSETAIVRVVQPLMFDPEQRKMIRDTYANGANESEFAVLMEVASARRLNPLLRQCYFVKRWDAAKQCEVWAVQVSIEGLRAIAERTGLYDGQDEPEFTEGNAGPRICKVRVYRKGWSRPLVGVAYWEEYVQTRKDGTPVAMWARGKHFMLAKCAEAVALRKGFPEDTSGLNIPEEMGSDGPVIDAEPVAAPAQSGKRTAALKAQLAAKQVRALPEPTAKPVIEAPKQPVLEMLPREEPPMQEEPPFPTDEDMVQMYPRDEAPKRAQPQKSEPSGPVVPFGRSKGKQVSEVETTSLKWLQHAVEESVQDPAKSRFRGQNQALLDGINAELGRRGE